VSGWWRRVRAGGSDGLLDDAAVWAQLYAAVGDGEHRPSSGGVVDDGEGADRGAGRRDARLGEADPAAVFEGGQDAV
jgi:hypothetical protein